MREVTIVDYGLGNITSICSAFSQVSAKPVLTNERSVIESATHLVLPGVGAFRDGMDALSRLALTDAIIEYCKADKPFLGICLGMQMIVDQSEEFGITEGLGIIRGKNTRISPTGIDGNPHKVPHIGWAPIQPKKEEQEWQDTILEGIQPETPFYFVHSYSVSADTENAILAHTDYNGRFITAVIQKGNTFGTQFHPEKSGAFGLHILKNFLNI